MELPIGFGFEGEHPREWVLRPKKTLDGLKYAGLAWFDNIKEVMEERGVFQSQMDPCVCYR